MKAWVIVVLAIAAGIVGAWLGYWIGHALGWTTNAVWPLQIGGGDRAILLAPRVIRERHGRRGAAGRAAAPA